MTYEDCPNCGGDGTVIIGYEERRGCPTCHGRGAVEAEA